MTAAPHHRHLHQHAHQHDSYGDRAVRGEPLEDLIIDIHCHPGVGRNFYWHGGDVDDMVRTMDTTGVDYACFSSYAAIGPDFIGGNDLVAEAIQRHPTRVLGCVVPNPRYPELVVPELQRRVEDQGFRGIKIHPTSHSYRVLGPNYLPVYEFADDHRLPILSHTYETPATVAKLAETYPNATFVWAHGIWRHLQQPDLATVARDHPNVLVDMAGSVNLRGMIEDFVRVAGAESVVFGSDYPVLDQAWELGQVAHAELPATAKRRIFGENLRGRLRL
ncbi:MAG: hypothetical protein CL878_01380 [Dehalococcoidia bacterium]|nr:hypothetical protein [Dehalococcoidia bacterium]